MFVYRAVIVVKLCDTSNRFFVGRNFNCWKKMDFKNKINKFVVYNTKNKTYASNLEVVNKKCKVTTLIEFTK